MRSAEWIDRIFSSTDYFNGDIEEIRNSEFGIKPRKK